MSLYRILEDAEGFGPVFLPKTSWQPDFTTLVKKERIPAIRLSTSEGWEGTDIEFLRELPELRAVEIYTDMRRSLRSASSISSLRELRLLGLEAKLTTPIDFSALSHLEVVKANWVDAISGVVSCSTLRHLNISNWPRTDLKELTIRRLTKLLLTSRKLESLQGIETLTALETVDLHACPKLSTVDGIQACQAVTHLELTGCKSIRDITPIGTLESLLSLHLDNSGDIATLEPLSSCTELEELSFFGNTRILDGKISAIEGLPLNDLVFAPRRHYDRTRKEALRT